MNKIKSTKREMKENYFIIGIGYCQAQTLLQFQNAIAYSSGSNGWACDYYGINSVVISTGYAYLSNRNTSYDYEVLKDYENKARAITSNYNITYDERKKQVNELLCQFTIYCKHNIK